MIDTTVPVTEYQLRRDLVKEVRKSKDKLFIIRWARPGYQLSGWYLVQVDDQETNWRQAKDEGIYHVRFFVRALADSRRFKVWDCRYWPELHEIKRDGVTMGPMIPTKPSKVDKYQDTVNLFEHKTLLIVNRRSHSRFLICWWKRLLRLRCMLAMLTILAWTAWIQAWWRHYGTYDTYQTIQGWQAVTWATS
jgi:hypothetical protein